MEPLQTSTRVPVVYTMGKVASSSTSGAIQAAGMTCHDIHTLTHKNLLNQVQYWLEKDKFPPQHVCVSMAYREQVLLKRNKCFYISLVRDPVARNMSAFFENLHLLGEEGKNETDPEKLFDYFSRNYQHTAPLTWFDREFKAELGIDVYARPFNHKDRYSRLDGASGVLFRADCPDEVKSRVLSKALGRTITVGRLNDGNNKYYSEAYNKMKKMVTFPSQFLDEMYDSAFVRHFWTPDEIDKMKSNWTIR